MCADCRVVSINWRTIRLIAEVVLKKDICLAEAMCRNICVAYNGGIVLMSRCVDTVKSLEKHLHLRTELIIESVTRYPCGIAAHCRRLFHTEH